MQSNVGAKEAVGSHKLLKISWTAEKILHSFFVSARRMDFRRLSSWKEVIMHRNLIINFHKSASFLDFCNKVLCFSLLDFWAQLTLAGILKGPYQN